MRGSCQGENASSRGVLAETRAYVSVYGNNKSPILLYVRVMRDSIALARTFFSR